MNLFELLRSIGAGSEYRLVARALRAARSGDVEQLLNILNANPELVRAKARENTILEWLTQPDFAPPRREIVAVLIAAGAELDRALNLAGCWNLPDLCRQLLAAGADPRARADAGITALESAAMHSSIEAANVLNERGLHRPSLWWAAATGQLDVVNDWVSNSCLLRRDAGPYRPNWAAVGQPPAEPSSDDDAEVIGEAFVFAALNDRHSVASFLLDIGVDVDSRPYKNTTALHFAIQFRRLEMVRFLLGRGASVAIRDEVFGADVAGWAKACDDGSESAREIYSLVNAAKPG